MNTFSPLSASEFEEVGESFVFVGNLCEGATKRKYEKFQRDFSKETFQKGMNTEEAAQYISKVLGMQPSMENQNKALGMEYEWGMNWKEYAFAICLDSKPQDIYVTVIDDMEDEEDDWKELLDEIVSLFKGETSTVSTPKSKKGQHQLVCAVFPNRYGMKTMLYFTEQKYWEKNGHLKDHLSSKDVAVLEPILKDLDAVSFNSAEFGTNSYTVEEVKEKLKANPSIIFDEDLESFLENK